MKLAFGIVFILFGSCLMYVAAHGIQSGQPGFMAIWNEVLRGIGGDRTGG